MKRFVILIGAVGVVCAVWFGGWLFVANEIEGEISALADNDGITAPRLTCDTLAVRGFPYRFAPRCQGATVVAGDLTVGLDLIQGTALFYSPTHIQIFAEGPAQITDAFTGANQEVRWTGFHASLRFSDGRIARVSALAEDLAYADTLIEEEIIGTAGDAELHMIDATQAEGTDAEAQGAALDLYARLTDVVVPGHEIEAGTVSLDGRLTGVPDMALWDHPDLLRLWQMAGGGFELRALEADADGLSLSASGGVTLTDSGRLSGRVSVASTGLVERFEGLADDPVAAMLIGEPDAQGAYSQTVNLRNGVVTVGIIPMMTIDPLF